MVINQELVLFVEVTHENGEIELSVMNWKKALITMLLGYGKITFNVQQDIKDYVRERFTKED